MKKNRKKLHISEETDPFHKHLPPPYLGFLKNIHPWPKVVCIFRVNSFSKNISVFSNSGTEKSA